MTLKEQIEALLTVDDLEASERQVFQFIVDAMTGCALEGTMYPETEAHVRGRFEWFFDAKGSRRNAA